MELSPQNTILGDRAKFLTTTAKEPHLYDYFHSELGYNFRMPNINAALACAQLEQLSVFWKTKRSLANNYEMFFKEKGIKFRTGNKWDQSKLLANVYWS